MLFQLAAAVHSRTTFPIRIPVRTDSTVHAQPTALSALLTDHLGAGAHSISCAHPAPTHRRQAQLRPHLPVAAQRRRRRSAVPHRPGVRAHRHQHRVPETQGQGAQPPAELRADVKSSPGLLREGLVI